MNAGRSPLLGGTLDFEPTTHLSGQGTGTPARRVSLLHVRPDAESSLDLLRYFFWPFIFSAAFCLSALASMISL
jgi:hypothetical protein